MIRLKKTVMLTIDVEQDERERLGGAVRAEHLAGQMLLEETVVVQLREVVGDGELLEDLVHPL